MGHSVKVCFGAKEARRFIPDEIGAYEQLTEKLKAALGMTRFTDTVIIEVVGKKAYEA